MVERMGRGGVWVLEIGAGDRGSSDFNGARDRQAQSESALQELAGCSGTEDDKGQKRGGEQEAGWELLTDEVLQEGVCHPNTPNCNSKLREHGRQGNDLLWLMLCAAG